MPTAQDNAEEECLNLRGKAVRRQRPCVPETPVMPRAESSPVRVT